jgi:phospholipase/carboxylesterase
MRRRKAAMATVAAAAAVLSPARGRTATMAAGNEWDAAAGAAQGRLTARPGPPPAPTAGATVGLRPLGLDRARDAYLHVPARHDPRRPTPLVVAFHGAGGEGRQMLEILTSLADAGGFLLLAPDSRGPTWDVILDDYGPDVAFIDRAMGLVFAEHAVDPARLAAAGFSDGASYALSLGLTNGGLFTHVLAFSPGFMAPTRTEDRPRFFVSHGVRDTVLPIDRTSRRVVPRLEAAGYEVAYREFPDGHTVPPGIARDAVAWFLGR